MTRVAALYSHLPSHAAACLNALQARAEIDLLLVHSRPNQRRRSLNDLLGKINACVLVILNWKDRDHRTIARRFKKAGGVVVAGMADQWEGSANQRLVGLTAPFLLQSSIDVFWVPGERQRRYAAELGYHGERCWNGFFSCDWTRFARIHDERDNSETRSFLFVGNYHRDKGIDLLAKAYSEYRIAVDHPWDLICAGGTDRALRQLLSNMNGVKDMGCVESSRVPELMSKASTLILPSRIESWGIVLHEAGAAGLPVICSDACGAGVHLLQPRYNGYILENGNVRELTQLMIEMHSLPLAKRIQMGQRSHDLSKQFTPELWANICAEGVRHLGAKWNNSLGPVDSRHRRGSVHQTARQATQLPEGKTSVVA